MGAYCVRPAFPETSSLLVFVCQQGDVIRAVERQFERGREARGQREQALTESDYAIRPQRPQ